MKKLSMVGRFIIINAELKNAILGKTDRKQINFVLKFQGNFLFGYLAPNADSRFFYLYFLFSYKFYMFETIIFTKLVVATLEFKDFK